MKHTILAGIALCMGPWLFAQEKVFTLEDITTNWQLYPESIKNFEWQDKEHFTYVKEERLVRGHVDGDTATLLRMEELNGKLPEGAGELGSFPVIRWEDAHTFLFTHENALWAYHTGNDALTREATYPGDAENTEIADNRNVAFTVGHNLYYANTATGSTTQITFDAEEGSEDLVYGEAAHRVEFGIEKGIFWSPRGNKVAFYKIDQSMVTDYPLTDYMEDRASVNYIKYPFAGDSSHHVTIGVFDTKTKSTNYLETGGPYDQFLTNITWSPDGESIYVAIVNRGQDTMWFKRFDASTGALRHTLFMETHPMYVEPEHGPIFLPGKDNGFLWFSERDGFNHLYHYKGSGELIRQLTSGDWEVTDVLGFDEKGRNIYISATKESPIQSHLYSVGLANGKMTKLTADPGMHLGKLSGDGSYILDIYSNMETPRNYQVINTGNGKTTGVVLQSKNPIEEYKLGETTLITLEAEDGVELHGRLIKPVDFDPSKKYPIIVYLYGGPHAQMVTESWLGGGNLFFQYLAQQGYIVFTLDNRGSKSRGLEFEQSIYQQIGTREMADQMEGVNYLKGLPYVDQDRMGVHGWSYGGFITTSLMLREPGAFKVGVAGGPVIDWALYEVMYGERYMGTPEENPEGYEQSNLLNYVGSLEGRLLVIHGMQDDVVVPQHSMQLIRKSVEEGVLIDFFPYPTHPHNVRGKDRAHLYMTIARYFEDHL